jgi:phosphoglycerate dehydrogenase-like enzyme
MNILVNLPTGFFSHAALKPQFDRLTRMGELRCTSHNTADEIRGDLAWAQAVIMWSWPKLTTDLLDAAPGLKYRGHIDIDRTAAEIALKRTTPISQSRGGWSPSVSEMALTLILACLRRTSEYHHDMRDGREPWVRDFPTDIDPRERQLTGRSVGIVGFGRIGRRLAGLLQPFHVQLKVCDPYVGDDALAPFNAARVTIDQLCEQAEIVVLCAAANDGTTHLINRDRIRRLRPNAVLINVARAALVDTEALVERLKQGDLIAAVDVFDVEPLPADSPLRRLPNLYLTPHRAGGVIESVERCVAWLIDDLEAVLQGKPQRNPLLAAMLPALDQ